jgi:hypothetical protein
MTEDEINAKLAADTIRAATNNGLTKVVPDDDGHTLCGNDEGEIVDVFPDGSWEYMGIREDKTMRTMSGPSAVLLAGYLQSEENKQAMEAHYAEVDDQPEGESE